MCFDDVARSMQIGQWPVVVLCDLISAVRHIQTFHEVARYLALTRGLCKDTGLGTLHPRMNANLHSFL